MEYIKTKVIFILTLGVSISIFFVSSIYGLDTLTINGDKNVYPIGNYMEYLEDSSYELTIEQVSSKDYSDDFIAGERDIIILPLSRANFWIKFSIKNNSDSKDWLLEFEHSQVDKIILYSSKKEYNFNKEPVWISGLSSISTEKKSKYRTYVTDLNLNSGQKRYYYLKISCINGVELSLRVWKDEEYYKKENRVNLYLGVAFGILVVMALFNFFIFLTIKDKSYLYYILVLIFFLLYDLNINGYMKEFISLTENILSPIKHQLVYALIGQIFTVLFSKSFLSLKKNIPKLNAVLNIFLAIYILSIIGIIIVSKTQYLLLYNIVIANIQGFMMSILLIIGFISFKKKIKSAKYYLLAFLLYFIIVFFHNLMRSGILSHSIILQYSLEIGFIVQITFLSIALGDKINSIRGEKHSAQEESLENQKKTIENLKQADKLKDEFLSRTSHELKTPLHGIIGLVESTTDLISNKLSGDELRNLSMVSYSGRRLLYLINDITDYSLLKHSEIMLYKKVIDFRYIVSVVMLICKPLTKGKEIKMINNIHDDIPNVYADETRLQQILYNLIGDAVKFTPKGFIKIGAQVSPNDDGFIEVNVSDSGLGIPDDEFDLVFESFTQLSENDIGISGMGLGLNISKILIELHGGTIRVDKSVNGMGTSFIFTLPIAKDSIKDIEKSYHTKTELLFI